MRSHARYSLLALLVGALIVIAAPQAAFGAKAFGVEKFFAANCTEATCNEANVEAKGFTQAGGHPPFGITDFTVNNEGGVPSGIGTEGPVTFIRTDVAPGVSTNPQAVPQCTEAEFKGIEVAEGVFTPPAAGCTAAKIGTNKAKVFAGAPPDIELTGTVYNLTPTKGLASLFGVALELGPLGAPGLFAHTLIKGHVEWASDYHDYFEIEVSPKLPLVSSRLVFEGNIGTGVPPIGSGGFLTNPTSCTGTGPQTTSTITLTSAAGAHEAKSYTTPLGTEKCGALPFAPTLSLHPETTQSDQPDGITATAVMPHDLTPTGIDSSQLRTAVVTLPEGMTLNPSAAAGLEACTPAQAHIHSTKPGVECKGASKIGTVELNVPGLPKGSLTGNIYLGGPESGPITTQPYTIYLDAESSQYGLSVRLKGEVFTNEVTGQVTTRFAENPEQPFSQAILTFNGGALAPIANPLACGPTRAAALFIPFSGGESKSPLEAPFTIDSNGKGGACPSPLPFAPTQSTENQTPLAGAHTNFTFKLERTDGQQYLSKVSTVLPAGLIGLIPTAEQCAEAQANLGTCPAGSQIGTVSAYAGSGAPFQFPGAVYLTGPYKGAPFGMSFVVPNVAGPFSLGTTITRATINVDPVTARVIVASELPLVVAHGIPVRLKKLIVSVNKQGFLINPTNCGALATESTLTGTSGTNVLASTPFQVEKCSALPFKPSFGARTIAKATKANGLSLETTLNLKAGSANVKSVLVTLPKQLPSRLTTLQKACPEATFAANPFGCPAGSFVGGVRANTPALKDKMTGPAILVSHGGAAFPDLDLVLQADGVRVILKGSTDIKKGITTTNFATTPDAPVSSITVNLTKGPHSALTGFGDLCVRPLLMPTVLTGQNGVQVKQSKAIAVSGCGVRIVGHKVIRNTAYLTIKTFAAGRISGRGARVSSVYRRLRSAMKATTLKVPLSSKGRRHGRPFKVRLRVGFLPKDHRLSASAAFVTVTFR
ncbi:MAG: hypothetical protein QOI03_16 [Solirubrobacteraceae bacterium]|jgi:hypothetical protein|nr:hypothetical protein [Solirubrobacteraceae bacterium]